MDLIEKALRRTLYRKSFYEFVKAFWHVADPSKFVDGWLIQYYCEVFQYMCKGWVGYDAPKIVIPEVGPDVDILDVRQNKQNLCLMVPPRHTKSMIFNVFGPTWLWLSAPIKAASVSHTGGLATQMNTKRHRIINSAEFHELFPEIELVTNAKGQLVDNRGAEMYSMNRNAFTGYGGDIIINDDLTNAETARKDQAEMSNAWAYYQNTMPSRINDINKCIIMNIQQRLAPNDIAGHIMNEPKLAARYVFITLPAIFQHETIIVFPISGQIKRLKKGDFLWPERFGNYESLRADVGETIFETQYLQNPIASDKTAIKPDMIIEKDMPDTPGVENAEITFASHDFPVKDKDTSDFLGSCLGYRVRGTLYITDCLEKRMGFTKGVEYVEQIDNVFPGTIQVIEDKANGSPILQQLQDTVAGMQAFQPGTASKFQRLESASLYMVSGNVIFVRTVFNKLTQQWELSPALRNLRQRLLNFPFVEHDDIVDAFSMLVLFVFMDRRNMVYGRSFNDENVVDADSYDSKYSTIFFNKEGDLWKAHEIKVKYAEKTKLIVSREIMFKASLEEGLNQLKAFAPKKSVFIDCSATPALSGMYQKSVTVERYEIEDFDKSVAQLNLAFSNKSVLVDKHCVSTKVDIESFKFAKSKDENVRYQTTKDGFVACMRVALKYYGGIT